MREQKNRIQPEPNLNISFEDAVDALSAPLISLTRQLQLIHNSLEIEYTPAIAKLYWNSLDHRKLFPPQEVGILFTLHHEVSKELSPQHQLPWEEEFHLWRMDNRLQTTLSDYVYHPLFQESAECVKTMIQSLQSRGYSAKVLSNQVHQAMEISSRSARFPSAFN